MSKTRYKTISLWLGVGIIAAALCSWAISPALAALGAANETVTVNFALNGGAPSYRASGFIYGLSQNATTPAQTLLSQIKVRFMRAGGSQIGCPNGGWINGGYTARWNFVKAYYAKAKAIGSKYIMLLPGIWGADGRCTVPRYPGDNGSWTEYSNFLTQVINDAKANGMTGSDVRWDIWNEPELTAFWGGRSQSQYFEMWRRGFQQIRAALPGAVIEGPSFAIAPSGGWWPAYLDFIKANNVIPNTLSWHDEGGGNDPVTDTNNLNAALAARGISVPGYSINEYGAFGNEQQPGPSAWYIARLERANGGVDGARGNWGNVGQTPSLYDTLGWLVTANANQTMGQWWVYKRYADQTGVRTSITPGGSVDGVVFQDASARRSITLLGKKNGGGTGTVTVQFTNVPAFLVTSGRSHVLIERMPSTNAFVSAPTVVSNTQVTLSGTTLTTSINWSTALDAYAITLTP